jgi:hypothetical protein
MDSPNPPQPDVETNGASSDAQAALVANLRGEIAQRITDQHQLLVAAAAIAGAAAAFAGTHLHNRPELLALLSLLFVGLALAILRHDHEITIIASLLLEKTAVGVHAEAQRAWERHRFIQMQGSSVAFVITASQTVGLYGVPVLAAVAFGWAALSSSPNAITWLVLAVTFFLGGVFLLGSLAVVRRYRAIGNFSVPP